jgi:hypothetical protein
MLHSRIGIIFYFYFLEKGLNWTAKGILDISEKFS